MLLLYSRDTLAIILNYSQIKHIIEEMYMYVSRASRIFPRMRMRVRKWAGGVKRLACKTRGNVAGGTMVPLSRQVCTGIYHLVH